MSEKKKSVKLNFIMNVILTTSTSLFSLITFFYVSRVLHAEGTGKVSFAQSVIFYFTVLARLGVPTYGVRACAKVRDDKEKLSRVTQELFIINAITCALSYLLLFVSIMVVDRFRQDYVLILIVASGMFFESIGVEWLYKALEHYTYITIRSMIFKVIGIIAMFLLVRNEADYPIYGGIVIFAASASGLMNFINVRKYVFMKPLGGYHFKPHLKAVVVFFAMSCATAVYTHLDVVMLGFMKTDTDVGYYNAAMRIKTILVNIVTSLGVVMLPRASYYIEKGIMEEFYRLARKAMNFVVFFSLPLMLYFILFARSGIYFLSGDDYEGAIIPMQIIMGTLPIIGISNICGMQMLVPSGREMVILKAQISGAVVDTILNLLLIPQFGAAGAAMGTLAAEVVCLGVEYKAISDFMNSTMKKINWLNAFLALAVAGGVSIWFNLPAWPELVIMICSCAVFFPVYVIVLLLRKEPIAGEIARQIARKIYKK